MDRHSPRVQDMLEERDNPAVSLLVQQDHSGPYGEGDAGLHGDADGGLQAGDYEDSPARRMCEEDAYNGEEYAAGDYAAGDYAAGDYAGGEYAPGEYTAGEATAGEEPPARQLPGVQFVEGLLGVGERQKQPGRPQRTRKKGEAKKPFLKRSWLCITPSGETSVLQADKYKLTAQLGMQTRDLRLLDPNMATTYPSAILCREQCIVVNLEHIKVIIATDRVLVVNHEDEGNARFVEELKQRIAHPSGAMSKSFPSTHDLQRMAAASAATAVAAANGKGTGGGAAPVKGLPLSGISAQLPFELRVLEICLDELASEYDMQATELEAAAYPALDTLAAKVTSPHLERVRRLKNRLVRLTTRVETVREVLEKFLDDDEDMHDLNLTANKEREAGSSVAEGDHMEPDGVPGHPYYHGHHHAHHGATAGAGAGEAGVDGGTPGPRVLGADGRLSYLGRRLSTRSSASSSSASTNSSVMESEVAEVEMLLEAYFMHFDNTYNRLTTLSEYIKDTEDLVNIKLDQHRNQLITTDLILTAFTASMAIITTVAGIFGMNLDSGLADAEGVFNQVTITTCIGSFLLFVGFVVWAWRYGLLVFD